MSKQRGIKSSLSERQKRKLEEHFKKRKISSLKQVRRRKTFQNIKRILFDADYQKDFGRKIMMSGLERWLSEGKIDAKQHLELQKEVDSEHFVEFIRHFGAHAGITIVLQVIPLPGTRSIARASWVVTFRAKAWREYRIGKITKEQYKKAKALHSLVVALPISFIPVGVGTVAYPVSALVAQARGIKLLDPKLIPILVSEISSEYFSKKGYKRFRSALTKFRRDKN